MAMAREEMDRMVDEHFQYEANDDVDGVMATLADDVEHEIVPSPFGLQTDKAGIRAYYELLFRCSRGQTATPLRRYYGDDFVVDVTRSETYLDDGAPFLLDGMSGPIDVRLLHIFEFEDGKISREEAWLDLAAIQRQLGATVG